MTEQTTGKTGPMEMARRALKKYYGYDSFRPGQETLISALLSRRDVVGIMPTGAGKSVCYQIPGILFKGITLVISPLISLMKDQVAALISAGIPAAYLNSSLTPGQYRTALARAAKGQYKIIYVAPERLETPAFMDFARKAPIALIAVDEAHCVSQWGQNFRPSYLSIAAFAESLPVRPIMAALTATATGPVKSDIVNLLHLNNPKVLVTGFDRPNLHFSVVHTRNKFDDLVSFLRARPNQSGIIYCLTRKDTEDVADRLNEIGFACGAYHAGMSDERRSRVQEDFIYDRLPLITATNAFGMGIDKSNVRFVVHYSMPASLENYYQEAGRAGRDGEESECVLFYSPQDYATNRFLIEKAQKESDNPDSEEVMRKEMIRLSRMDAYTKTTFCLRSYILEYFGESSSGNCGKCSNCLAKWQETDITEQARLIARGLDSLPRAYGIALSADFLRGSANAKIRAANLEQCEGYGILENCSAKEIRALLENLLITGYLVKTQDTWQTLHITPQFRQALASQEPILMRSRSDRDPSAKTRKRLSALNKSEEGTEEAIFGRSASGIPKAKSVLRPERESLFQKLRVLRMEFASKEHVPPYIVFSDQVLRCLCEQMPADEEELLEIPGIGPRKAERYGQAFLQAIADWKTEQEESLPDQDTGDVQKDVRTQTPADA